VKLNLVLIILVACLVIAGCSPGTVDPPVNGNGGNGDENPKPVILQGQTLEDLGLELTIGKLERFKDHNQELISYSVSHYQEEHKRFAKSTGLIVEFSEKNGYDLFMCIQGFKKSSDSDVTQLIEVNSKQYNLSELEQYKLYEDDEVVVYEITDLLPKEEVFSKIQDWVDEGDPFQWMFEVLDYLKTYDDIEIARVQELP